MSGVELLIGALVGFLLGAVLGLLGGGGGILAIPLLIHVLGLGVDEATTMSLVVVAIGAAAGLVPHARAGRVAWRTGILFGWIGIVGATAGSRAAVLADDRVQMAVLVVLIFVAAAAMLRPAPARAAVPVLVGAPPPPAEVEPPVRQPSLPRTIVAATGVGFITGFVGVGGGFIAVPALIWAVGLPVRAATATGLLVIVLNSIVALIARGTELIEWPLATELAIAAIAGAVTGAMLSHRVSSARLKQLFGLLLLVVGTYEAWVLLAA